MIVLELPRQLCDPQREVFRALASCLQVNQSEIIRSVFSSFLTPLSWRPC